VDMELKERASGDLFNYSLKTCKQWGERMENSYKQDLQGITEIWAIEQESIARVDEWTNLVRAVEQQIQYAGGRDKNLQMMKEYLIKKLPQTKRVMGTRFCFLVKGPRKKPEYNMEDTALYITYNPLIRGYKNIGPATINYAHSWRYPNPENKSGFSILGKGWEPFNLWESDITIKDWVNALFTEQVQPECGNPVKGVVITPTEGFRDDREIRMAISEIRYQERNIEIALEHFSEESEVEGQQYVLDEYFPHYRGTCEFYFGEQCSYYGLCWKPEIAVDPLGSGLYQIRTPHHVAELEQND
jgi:hypothetical protein